MSKRIFTLCNIAIAMAMGAAVGYSVAVGNAIVPIVAVAGGMGLQYLCRRQVKEIVEDERLYKITEKASQITFRISTIMMAVTGAVLIALSHSISADFRLVGLTLVYAVCALIVLNLVLYIYYSRKY